MIRIEDVFQLKRNAATTQSKMQGFAEKMAECCGMPLFSDAGVTVENSDGKDILLTISTPTSLGRLRNAWAGSPKDLIGVLAVERVQLDKYDRERWDTVLSICFHQSGLMTFHSSLDGLVEPQIEGGPETDQDPHWVALTLTVYYLSRFNDIR